MAKQITREQRLESEIAWLRDKFPDAVASIETQAEIRARSDNAKRLVANQRIVIMAEGAAVAYGDSARELHESSQRLVARTAIVNHVQWCRKEARIQWTRAGKPIPSDVADEGVNVEPDGA